MALTDLKKYPVDTTGIHPNNLIVDEVHEVTLREKVIIPRQGYFYADSLVVRDAQNRQLTLGVDFVLEDFNDELTSQTGKSVVSSIVIKPEVNIAGNVTIQYQCYGNLDQYSREMVSELVKQATQARETTWLHIKNKPRVYPPSPHRHPLRETMGWIGTTEVIYDLVSLFSWQRQQNLRGLYGDYSRLISDVDERIQGIGRTVEIAETYINTYDAYKDEINMNIGNLRAYVEERTDATSIEEANNRLKQDILSSVDGKGYVKTTDERIGRYEAAVTNINNLKSNYESKIPEIEGKLTGVGTNQTVGGLLDTKMDKTEFNRVIANYVQHNQIQAFNSSLADKVDRSEISGLLTNYANGVSWSNLQDKPEFLPILRRNTSQQDSGFELTPQGGASFQITAYRKPNAGETAYLRLFDKGISYSYRHINGTSQAGNVLVNFVGQWNGNFEPGANGWRVERNSVNRSNQSDNYAKLVGQDKKSEAELDKFFKGNLYNEGHVFTVGEGNRTTSLISAGGGYLALHLKNTLEGSGLYPILTEAYFTSKYANLLALEGKVTTLEQNSNTTPEGLRNTLSGEFAKYVPLRRVQSNQNDFTSGRLPTFKSDGAIAVKGIDLKATDNNNRATVVLTGDKIQFQNYPISVLDLQTRSDRRLKDNIRTVENALETVTQLRGCTYNMKGLGWSGAGVIAQELQEVLPALVSEDPNGMLSVNYKGLNAWFIEAFKEVKKENDELKARLSQLEKKLNTLLMRG